MSIQLADICFITEDVQRLRGFYEAVFLTTAEGDEFHSTLVAGTIAFTFDYVGSLQENSVFHYVSASGSNNVIVGFSVDDVDDEYRRLMRIGAEMMNQPTTHPWGARSFQFKDPDGNILNFRSVPIDK